MRCACSCDLPPLLVAFDRFVGVSGVRLGVLGGCCVAGLDFDELRARLSSSYVAALLFVVGAADHSVRCFVIDRALCLLQRPHPTPHRVRSVRGCVVCSLGFVGLLGGGEGAGALGCAQTRCSRAEGPCGVFSRLFWSPTSPSRSLLSAGRFLESTTTHVYHKPSSSCAVYLYVPVSVMRTTGKFAAGVTTRRTRDGPAPNKQNAT